MIDEVRGSSYTGEPIAFELEDGDIRETIRPYIMGRIVDAEQFFQKYHCDAAADNAMITFEMEDSFLAWNNRAITVCFNKGECSVSEAHTHSRVKLSIATLTTLLIGYKTAVKLYRMGRIAADCDAVVKLDNVLLHESP